MEVIKVNEVVKAFRVLKFCSLVLLGLKFKLVKSNSCSSRLELTGTGNYDATEEMRNLIHSQDEAFDEHEETVKDMVSRLELKKVDVASKPRIIESRCIEKTKELSPKVTINHQSFERAEDGGVPCEVVTVNNHSNSGSSDQPQDEGLAKAKVVRNKNVDLAMASVTKRNEQMRNPKENLAQKDLQMKPSSKWSSACKMESAEMVKHQDKINNCAHIKSHPHVDAPPKSAQKSMAGAADEKPIKMVNWSTVGVSLGKEYIANDRNLIQTKIYDEMEFEEFEVMGEQHYDSLNSK